MVLKLTKEVAGLWLGDVPLPEGGNEAELARGQALRHHGWPGTSQVAVVSRVNKTFMNQQRTRGTRLCIAIVVFVVVAALAAIHVSQVAIWVPTIAFGLTECDSASRTNTFDYLSIVESFKRDLLGEYVS